MLLVTVVTVAIATVAVAQNLESDYVAESRLLENELERYLEQSVFMLRAGGLDPAKKAMLRALGYLPPEPN